MSEIDFYKLVASGNDFVVVDNRQRLIRDPKSFAKKVCTPHVGVAADGILLVEPSRNADFTMRIINSDGSEAEACGNGYRCISLYANRVLGFSSRMSFETLAGIIQAEVRSESIKVQMAEPKDYQTDICLNVNGRSLKADFINTGVPHAVIFVEGVEKIPAYELGREIRYHKTFEPKGTNVNFVEVTGENSLHIRTYERGVENITLACGSGAVASAICASFKRMVKQPVQVLTKSGEIIQVTFSLKNNKPTQVFLEGRADFVYQGKLLMKDLEK